MTIKNCMTCGRYGRLSPIGLRGTVYLCELYPGHSIYPDTVCDSWTTAEPPGFRKAETKDYDDEFHKKAN